MKTTHTIYLTTCILLGIAGLSTSCQRESLYDSQNIEKTTDIKIPAGFDWTTTRSVKLSINSEVNASVKIYLDKACSDDQLAAQIVLTKGVQEISIDVPTGNTEIYIQYMTKSGQKSVATYSLTAPTRSSAATISIKLPEDALPGYEENPKNHTYYTNGNVMFEDNWPNKGDYDFNDFVIRYEMKNILSYGEYVDQNEGMTVTIYFAAIGGAYPYRLGLQLDCLPAKFIDQFTVLKATDGITPELVNVGETTPAVIIFKGCEELKGKNGATYFNTEKGFTTTDLTQLPSVTFNIKVNYKNNVAKDTAMRKSSLFENQNFFLQTGGNGGKEIHLRGYAPTHLYKNYESDAADKMKAEIPYCSEDGFVWGIKAPLNTPHAYEKVDIMKAFPLFEQWVTSNGDMTFVDWHKTFEPNMVIEVKK